MTSHLLAGTVRHRRLRPTAYGLSHHVWYLALELGRIDEAMARLRLLSHDRPNVLSFYDRDHLPDPAQDLDRDLRVHLRAQGIDPIDWTVTLVANARVLGYVFDPASFYLCRDAAGALRIVVVEVHNTFGERHLYMLHPTRASAVPGNAGDRDRTFRSAMDKELYVSPFIDPDGRYSVRVRDEPDRLWIAIDEIEDGRTLLATSLTLRRLPMSDRNLARLMLRYPLVTHKTIAMIHWHALRLRLRGLRFRPHRVAPASGRGQGAPRRRGGHAS